MALKRLPLRFWKVRKPFGGSKGIPVFNFGKFKDRPIEEALKKEPGYYNWIMNGEFSLYTKKVLTKIRLKMK